MKRFIVTTIAVGSLCLAGGPAGAGETTTEVERYESRKFEVETVPPPPPAVVEEYRSETRTQTDTSRGGVHEHVEESRSRMRREPQPQNPPTIRERTTIETEEDDD